MRMSFCVTIHHRKLHILLLTPICDDRLIHEIHWHLVVVDSSRYSIGLGNVGWTLTLSHGEPTRTDHHVKWRETVFDSCSIVHRIYDYGR